MAFAPLRPICRPASSYCSNLCLRYSSRYHKTKVPRFLPRVHDKRAWLQISGSLYRGTSQPYRSALSLSSAASRCPWSYFLQAMHTRENGLSFSAGGSSRPASGHEVADDRGSSGKWRDPHPLCHNQGGLDGVRHTAPVLTADLFCVVCSPPLGCPSLWGSRFPKWFAYESRKF